MSSVIVPIVEGQSEIESVPILLRRIIPVQLIANIEVGKPIRIKRNQIVRPNEIERAIELAYRTRTGCKAIIVLLDEDDDCAKISGPEILKRAVNAHNHLNIKVIFAVKEFEAWFIASIESLRGKRGISSEAVLPKNPEDIRGAKAWLQGKMVDGRSYVETDDQPALTHEFDLVQARANSPSFDKFMRDVEAIIGALE